MRPERVVMLTGHHLRSARRAGFHHLAMAFAELGSEVLFATVGVSWAGLAAGGDHRRELVRNDRRRRLDGPDGLATFSWVTPFHPMNLRFETLNRLTPFLARAYGRLPLGRLTTEIARADLIVVESGSALALVPRVARLAPRARIVYRQSDSLEAVRAHPSLIPAERRALEHFDLISVPSPDRVKRFSGSGVPVRVDFHGMDIEGFSAPTESPYPAKDPDGKRCVFVGVDGLDDAFLKSVSLSLPTWEFHLIGPWERFEGFAPNVRVHGTRPFAETIGFIQHADVGLHCIARPHPETFAYSLKVLQYTFCRLPVVAPRPAAAPLDNVFAYDPGDETTYVSALMRAQAMPSAPDASWIGSWSSLALSLTTNDGARAG